MYIVIDNSEEQIVLRYQDGESWVRREFARTPGGVVESVAALLNEVGGGNLRGLAVVVGQGRFTATRVATTVANTLGFARQIPVVAIVDGIPWNQVARLIKESPVGRYVTPTYSGLARIGTKSIKS